MTKSYSALDLQKMPVLGLVPESMASPGPATPVVGQLWWDSTNNQLKVCTNATGPVWTQCDNVTGGTASNVADGDKGDITVASGVWTIDPGVVTSTKIADGTITLTDLSATGTKDATTFLRGDNTWTVVSVPVTAAKQQVRTVAVGNVPLTDPMTNSWGGVTLTAGDRMLLVGQTNPAENGIYLFGAPMNRATDMDTAAECAAAEVSVLSGTYGGTHWLTNFKATDTLNTTAMSWGQYINAGSAAGGDLTGTYPNPDIAPGVVDLTTVNTGLIESGISGGSAATTAVALRRLGTGANDAAAGNDSRFTDSRAPSGAAGGDLAGSTYPNPVIANGAITSAKIFDGTITDTDVSAANKDGVAGTASMRTLGTGAQQALAGNTRLDTITAPTGPVSLNNQRIIQLADPVGTTDAANKQYVDNAIQGLDAKASVRVASTVNVANLGNNPSPSTLDGVALVDGDRVLLKNQTTPSQNGIYLWNSLGANRAVDMDTWAEVPGAFVFVEEGATQADTGWVSTADRTGTLNTTTITWTQFSGAGSFVDGAALLKTGNTLDVQVDNVGIEVAADALRLKDGGVTNAKLAGSIDAATKLTNQVPIANGGTGAPTVAAARNNLVVPGKVTIPSPALTANTWSANIAHGLGPITTAPHVQVTEAATGENVIIDWKVIDVNNIQLRAGMAVSASALNVLVHA